ncbi:hypothetical protein CKO31_01735 [Thiohalocapsa halophila]|uniref:Uncharacterized protein n=2 Tax=Thiohalocapsa halophila TaxID=69359 RepID=A0ABS1CC46_9GAMM|nr:hypothetical protein [Thiohalocapsa halophila]
MRFFNQRGQRHLRWLQLRLPPRALVALACALLCLSLTGCSGGIYGSIGVAGPSVDLGPVRVNTGVHLGRWL